MRIVNGVMTPESRAEWQAAAEAMVAARRRELEAARRVFGVLPASPTVPIKATRAKRAERRVARSATPRAYERVAWKQVHSALLSALGTPTLDATRMEIGRRVRGRRPGHQALRPLLAARTRTRRALEQARKALS